jgi:D-beta-D-heptose 7-phosphate kinase/D-beta-D-heptose 1-phosphate adenosyltransferase
MPRPKLNARKMGEARLAPTFMTNISQILESAPHCTIAVLGDLMLDEWMIGDASRISPEAPVPVVRWKERKIAPGGAANVVMNLRSLGAQVLVAGVVGDDSSGHSLAQALTVSGADVSGLVFDASRPTTLKTRVVASRQQMLRIDRESDEPFSDFAREKLEERLAPILEKADILCLSDYDKGLITCGIAGRAMEKMHAAGKRVTGGPKPHNLNCFSETDFLSLNEKEASEAAGFKINSDDDAHRAGHLLRERLKANALVITRGGKGVLLFEKGSAAHQIGGHEVEVFDVAGAGDTFLAGATLALASGAVYSRAAQLGNLAAAASVRHVGVVAVSPEEVLRVQNEVVP